MKIKTALILLVAMIPLAAFSPHAQAVTRSWLSVSGTWSDPTNWSGSVVPTITDTAIIDNGSAALLPATISGTAQIIEIGVNGTGSLSISGGTLTGTTGDIGFGVHSSGTATISGGTWSNAGILNIGQSGTGTLIVNGGFLSGSTSVIGTNATSSGTATVSSGTWSNTAILTIGQSGTGTLLVNGGALTTFTTFIGSGSAANGTATVSSGSWSNSNSLTIGQSGTGTLTVSGGTLTASTSTIGSGSTSNGTAMVTSGSWGADNLTVGQSGSGALSVSGGNLTSTFSTIGSGSGSIGTVTVSSSGSWNSGSTLTVGQFGSGTLNVNGGTLTSNSSTIGSGTVSIGTATITSGSWTNSNTLTVGQSGSGTLNVNGGNLTDSSSTIGSGSSSHGTAIITSGSWISSGSLVVGQSGSGTLNIDGGNTVIKTGTGTLVLAQGAGSFGTLNLGSGTTAGTLGAGIVTGGTGTAVVNFNQTGTYTFAPQLSGTLTVNSLGTGLSILTGTDNYVGATTISAGTLQFAKTSSLYGGGSNSWTSANITAASGATFAINVGGANQFTNASVTTLLTNLTTSGTAGLQAGSSIGFDTTNATSGTFTIADSIADSSGLGGGSVGVTKLGTNTLTLSGSSTYSGSTNVTDGVLNLAGALGNSLVTVGNATTASLTPTFTGGSGTSNGGSLVSPGNTPSLMVYSPGTTAGYIGGTLTISGTSATGSPGSLFTTTDTVKTLQVSNLMLNGGSILNYQFNGSANSFVDVLGTLTLAGSGTTGINLYNEGLGTQFALSGTYDLFQYGTLSGSTAPTLPNLTVLNTNPSDNYTFGTSTISGTNYVTLTIEPPTTSTSYSLLVAADSNRIIVGGTTGLTATITNTGSASLEADSLAFTNLNVTTSGSTSGGTLPVASGSPLATGSSASGSTIFSGATSGTYTINPVVTSATNATIGGNATLSGSTPATVVVVNNRVITSTGTVNLGRFINGQTSSTGNAELTSSGLYAVTASETVNTGSTTFNGITLSSAANQAFDGSASTQTANLSVQATGSTSLGTTTVTGTYTSVSGETGLTGQTVSAPVVSVTTDAVQNRVITSSTANLGSVLIGGTASPVIMVSLSSPGSHDQNTDLAIASGTTSSGGVSVASTAQAFNGTNTTGSFAVTGNNFTTSGATSGTVSVATTGEHLGGEVDAPVSVGYTANVFQGVSTGDMITGGTIDPGGSSVDLTLSIAASSDGGQRAAVTVTGFSTSNSNLMVIPSGNTTGPATNAATTPVVVGTVVTVANVLDGNYTFTATESGTTVYSDPTLAAQGTPGTPVWAGLTVSVSGQTSNSQFQVLSTQIQSGSSLRSCERSHIEVDLESLRARRAMEAMEMTASEWEGLTS